MNMAKAPIPIRLFSVIPLQQQAGQYTVPVAAFVGVKFVVLSPAPLE